MWNHRVAAFVLSACLLPLSAAAQKAPVVKSAMVTKTVTIEAIDHTNRLITFKDEAGATDMVQAGPGITRFDELKVGDKVTFKYYESLVFQVKKSGAAAPDMAQAGVDVGGGKTPGGTMSRQLTMTVTVVSVDPAVPSITVKTEDGSVVTRKIQDPKNLEGVQAGDKIVITYTQALLTSVAAAK